MNPKIDIVAPAHRPQNWMSLYDSIGDNQVDFELIFVGPNPPNYELPKNFRFIKSLVKPTQCLEIAYRNSSAELVMNIADDCMFKTLRPLDKLYKAYKKYNNEKLLLSCRYTTNGIDESHFTHRFNISDPTSPIMPACALMSKKLFNNVGGIDSNFIAVMWDLDIAMRVYASGGCVIISDVIIDEDRGKNAGNFLCSEFWGHDRTLLESLWTSNGKIHFSRNKPVKPFLDKNILNASQGPRGRWRGSGFLFMEKIEDTFRRSILARINRGIRKPSLYFSYAKRIALYIKHRLLGLRK